MKRSDSGGILLVEMLVAALLLGAAAVGCVSLVHANSRRAQSNREFALAHMAAVDLANILVDEPLETIAAAAANPATLAGLWSGALAGTVPPGGRDAWARSRAWVTRRVRASVELVAPGVPGDPGLYRLTLTVADARTPSKVIVLFRPGRRREPRKVFPPEFKHSLPPA